MGGAVAFQPRLPQLPAGKNSGGVLGTGTCAKVAARIARARQAAAAGTTCATTRET